MTPTEDVEALRAEVQLLRDEIEVLRNAIDEFRESFDWAVQNNRPVQFDDRIRRITSMPVDPTAEDFAARVNTVSRDDLTADEAEPDDLQREKRNGTGGGSQTELF